MNSSFMPMQHCLNFPSLPWLPLTFEQTTISHRDHECSMQEFLKVNIYAKSA